MLKRNVQHIIFLRPYCFFFVLFLVFSGQYAVAQNNEDGKPIIEEKIVTDDYYDEEEEQSAFRDKNESDPYNVNPRNLPPGYTQKLKEDGDFWYADAAPATKKTEASAPVGDKGTDKKDSRDMEEYETRIDTSANTPAQNPSNETAPEKKYTPVSKNRSGLQTILLIIIITGFVGILAWYIITNNISFKKNKKLTKPVNPDEMPEDIFAINYMNEVDKAVAQGNFRLAIRLQYLRMLKSMAERNIINYKQEKTNLDYMMELQPTIYYNNFFRTTRHYEFAWYGEFPVNQETYALVRRGFDDFEKQITG